MKNPLIPMMAITGNPTKMEINEVMELYAKQNIQQVLIYPRSGCEIEYMSEQWIDVCSWIIEFAANNNIDVWIYDEFNWPSGTCRGKVMREHKEYVAKAVFLTEDGYGIKNYNDYFDILNPDAVDSFIEYTHEVYYKNFGEYFGSVIKGFFTDEPDFSVCTWGGMDYPFTKNLDIEYKQRFGRDLFEDMMTRFENSDYKVDFYNLLAEKFRVNYIRKINDWCIKHNVVLTGHTMNEHFLDGAVNATGCTITALKEFSLPGIDEIATYTIVDQALWIAFGCIEAAARDNGRCAAAELFAHAATDVIPARVEQMIWLASMFKISKYFFALSPLDARGNVEKKEWFNPMNYMNPWFEGYPEIGLTASKAATFAEKNIKSEVFVRYPLTATIKNLGKENETLTDERLKNVLKGLVRAQIQWQLIEEDVEPPKGSIVVEINDEADFSAQKIIEDIKTCIQRDVFVLENNELADELLLRKFDDGSYVIVDLQDNGKDRELILCDGNEKHKLWLKARGHYISGEDIPQKPEIIYNVNCMLNMQLNGENTLRCNLNEDRLEYEFIVEDDLEEIRLAIRNYHFNGEIYFDGKKMISENECTCMTKGLNELYKCTDSFSLSKGVHTITTTVAAESEYFLPTCIICGNFAGDDINVIKKLPDVVSMQSLEKDILAQYVGRIELSAEIEIPNERCILKADASNLYTRLFINNDYIGGMISGYEWEIPDKYRGQVVDMKFEQYTSIAPVFGELKNAVTREEFGQNKPKNYTYRKFGKRCGIINISFIKTI